MFAVAQRAAAAAKAAAEAAAAEKAANEAAAAKDREKDRELEVLRSQIAELKHADNDKPSKGSKGHRSGKGKGNSAVDEGVKAKGCWTPSLHPPDTTEHNWERPPRSRAEPCKWDSACRNIDKGCEYNHDAKGGGGRRVYTDRRDDRGKGQMASYEGSTAVLQGKGKGKGGAHRNSTNDSTRSKGKGGRAAKGGGGRKGRDAKGGGGRRDRSSKGGSKKGKGSHSGRDSRTRGSWEQAPYRGGSGKGRGGSEHDSGYNRSDTLVEGIRISGSPFTSFPLTFLCRDSWGSKGKEIRRLEAELASLEGSSGR